MKNSEIRQEWEVFIKKYVQYFLDNETIWRNTLKKVIEYIDKNNKLPSQKDKNKDIKSLGTWLSHQKTNYKNEENIMKNSEIRQEWKVFSKKYEQYILDNETVWKNTLQKVIAYIDINNKLPSKHDKNKDIKTLGTWLSTQKINYKNEENIMKNSEIRQEWKEFIKKYERYFLDNETIWKNNLQEVIAYIDANNKLPSTIDKNKDIKSLGQWLSDQKKNYKNEKFIKKDPEIRQEWNNFLLKYSKFFKKFISEKK